MDHSNNRTAPHGAKLSLLLAPLAYLVVLLGSAFAAYPAMFNQFEAYDDSGFFIHTIRLFSQGQPLYDRLFSEYGPFSYELWAGVFGLLGQTISTDSARMAIIVLWLFTSLLLGVSCQRLTGRLTIGVIVQVLSFSALTALDKEPMHPSGVICALLGVTVAVVSFVLPRRPRAALYTLGALVAALALTKINVGGFAALAVAYAAVMALPALRRIIPLRWFVVAALVAIGPVLMSSNLARAWVQDYAILAVGGGLALVLITYVPSAGASGDGETAWRWVRWLLSGFIVCAAVVIAIVLALGSSFGAMFQEIVEVPLHQAHAYTAPMKFTRQVVFLAVGAVVAAWIIRRLRAGSPRAGQPGLIGTGWPGLAGALGRILVALAIWLSIAAVSRYHAFALVISLAWVAAIPSTRDDGNLQGRFVRVLLPSLAVLQALMAYPVAGTQVKFAVLLFLVCGAVCFADGWSDLEVWSAARDKVNGLSTARTIMVALGLTLVVALAFQYVARPIKTFRHTYATFRRLPIAGASRLHLPAKQVSAFTQITVLLRTRCKTVITLPALLSFNLWSGLPAPSGMTVEQFWRLLDHSQEQAALASARAAPGLCAVSNYSLASYWDNGKPLRQVPLVRFIEHDFTPIAQYPGGYVVSTRRPPSTPAEARASRQSSSAA